MWRTVTFSLFLTLAAAPAYDFVTKSGLRWDDGLIPMNLQLDITRPPTLLIDGKTSWNAVALEALDIWNTELSRVQFDAFASDVTPPRDGNDHNEVFFSSEIYGHQFGSRVLAVTTAWRVGGERVEGDTIFNTEIDWDSYRGPLDLGLVDLRRVAAHEFGHTLGLDHPDAVGQVVSALMNSIVSDLETIAQDDIYGVRALYPPAVNYALNVVILPPGAGVVTAVPEPNSNGKYPAGTLVTLAAKPNRGFRFNFWGGDENLAARKLKLRVVDNEDITVNFSTNFAPRITLQPRSQLASIYDMVFLSVKASSPTPMTYQWERDGVALGVTNATLVLHLTGHENSGLYSVRVSNDRGETQSKPARLVVDGY